MGDFWFGAFEWVMEKMVLPLVVIGIVLLIVGLPVLLYASYRQSQSPTFELHKNEWACTDMRRTPVTTYIKSGNVMVPMTTYSNDCFQWSKQP